MSATKTNIILKSAIAVFFATALAKLSGFAKEAVLAAFYGAGAFSDAFVLASVIPDTLLGFVSASVAASYMPVYYEAKNKNRFTSNVITCLVFIGLAFSVFATLFPKPLVRLFAFHLAPETSELAAYFVQYMAWAAIFILLIEIYNARLEIEGDFFSAGIRGIWRNGMVIVGIAVGALSGYPIIIALSPAAGSVICMLLLAAGCRKHRFRYKPHIDLRAPEIKQMLLLISPMLITMAIHDINLIINRNFAASLPAGSIASLSYASKLQALFSMLIGQSLTTVLFPQMSSLAVSDDMEQLRNMVAKGITYIAAVAVPLCFGVAVLARPAVRILLQRGAFTAEDTLRTAMCLATYAPLIVTYSVNGLLTRTLHATKTAATHARVSAIMVAINVVLNILLIKPLGIQGLALSSTLASASAMGLLLICLRGKLGGEAIREFLAEFVKFIFAAGVMGICVYFAANKLPLMSAPAWQSAFLCAMLAAVAAVIYFVALLFLRSKITFELLKAIIKLTTRKAVRG